MTNKKHPCHGCIYMSIVSSSIPCCNYIFIEDKRRPCPPGAECTVKTTKRKSKPKTKPAHKPKPTKTEYNRAYWQKIKAQRINTCKQCGTQFHPEHGNQSFCSDECRATFTRERQRIYDKRRRRKPNP